MKILKLSYRYEMKNYYNNKSNNGINNYKIISIIHIQIIFYAKK